MALEVAETVSTRQFVGLIAEEGDGAEGFTLVGSQLVHAHPIHNVEQENTRLVAFTGGNSQELGIVAP
jgi:hypothetical protein